MPDTLLNQLAKVCASAPIEFPQLRAVSLAQWLIESGRATSDLATHHYNFGGLKWRPEMKPFAAPVEYKANDGVDLYCRFESLEKFVAGYWGFLERSPYKGWKDHVASAADFIGFIGPIYCPPNPNYAAKVLALVPEAQGLLDGTGAPPAEEKEPDQPAPATLKKLRPIVLDPGHGGTQKLGGSSPNNAKSISGALEKNLALDFCNILKKEIEQRAKQAGESVDVFLTRTTDVNVGIADRAKVAAAKNAKLFLSVHFNGLDRPEVRGVETFFATASNGKINEAEDKAFAGKMHAALLAGMLKVDSTTKDRKLKPDTATGPGRLGTLNDVSLGNVGKQDKCLAAYYEVEFITNPTVEKVLISGPDAATNRAIVMGSVAEAMLAQLRA